MTLIDQLKEYKLDDGLLVSKPENIQYITGLKASFGMVFIQKSGQITLITDGRYAETAKQLCQERKINFQLFDTDFPTRFAQKIRGTIGVETSATLGQLEQFKKWFSNVDFKPVSQIVENIRAVKTTEEIEHTRITAEHTDQVLHKISSYIRPGVTEIELCFTLENLLRENGKFGIAFNSIVAFGEHTARPHHSQTDRKLNNNEPILIDCGSTYQDYHSDITRNWWCGNNVDKKYKEKHDLLLKIQTQVNQKCISGTATKDIDNFVRKELKSDAEFFTHSLGHGTGLEIHELPNLSVKSESILQTNNIITCEPGLYYPGEFGIRIEDQLVVESKFSKKHILTQFPKELQIIT